ncbi:hypothetical protein BJY00DRAFT_275534 [Aspergillus carlsbadensis]|nr:hypothetical protein BJY00DRAFT_275534 [Aspergillus carlsbadensis]
MEHNRAHRGELDPIFLLVLVPYLPLLSPGPNRELEGICSYPELLDHAIFKEQYGQVGPCSVLFVCCVTIPTGIYHRYCRTI